MLSQYETTSLEANQSTPSGFIVFKMRKTDGTVLYVGAISSDDLNRKIKTIEANDYFADKSSRFGFSYEQSEEVDSLSVLGVDPNSVKSWDDIKSEIVRSELPPLHKLLSELAKQEVPAEILDDLKRDLDFEANKAIFERYSDLYFQNDVRLKRAYEIAVEAHKNDWQKGFQEVPYSNHPIQMANIAIGKLGIRDSSTIQAILLHDVVEDTSVSFEDLSSEFSSEVIEILHDVTKDENETRDGYLQRVANPNNPKSKLVKCVDRFHNLLRSFSMTTKTYTNPKKTFKEYLEGYIRETEEIYREAFETKTDLDPIALKFFRYLEAMKKRIEIT